MGKVRLGTAWTNFADGLNDTKLALLGRIMVRPDKYRMEERAEGHAWEFAVALDKGDALGMLEAVLKLRDLADWPLERCWL